MAKFKSKLKALMMKKSAVEGDPVTQKMVADATGLSYPTIYRWYHNRIERLEPETVASLTSYFDCPMEELVEVER